MATDGVEHKFIYYVYILQSEKDGNYYIGYTNNLKLRIKQHNDGKTKSLKFRRPLILIGYEIYNTRQDAYLREREIKKYKGGNSFKLLIKKFIGSPPPEAGSR